MLRRRHLPCVDCHVVTYYNLFDVLFFYCFQVLLLDSIRRLQFNDCEPTLEFQFSLKVFQGLLYINIILSFLCLGWVCDSRLQVAMIN